VEGALGPVTPTEARKLASQSINKAKDDFADTRRQVDDHNYQMVSNAMTNPGARLMPSNLQAEAGDQLTRLGGYGGSPGSILNQAISASETAIDRGGLTFDALKNLRSDLYKKWKSMEGKGGIEYADYTKLIGAITKDMEDVLRQAGGPRAVQVWERANATHGIGKDLAKEISTAVGPGKWDTAAADSVFNHINDKRPNIGAINTLRHQMIPAEWDKVQAAVVARMGADDAGNFSMQKFISANNKMSDAGRDALFGVAGTPKRDAYDAIMTLSKSIQNVERFHNVSKTAPIMLGAGVAVQAWEDYKGGNYLRTAGELGAGAILASILSRPATARNATNFAKAMDKYLNTPAMWAAGKIPKAAEVAARNFAISVHNSTGIDKEKLINAFTAPTPLWEK
jgi:hypothetical protein